MNLWSSCVLSSDRINALLVVLLHTCFCASELLCWLCWRKKSALRCEFASKGFLWRGDARI